MTRGAYGMVRGYIRGRGVAEVGRGVAEVGGSVAGPAGNLLKLPPNRRDRYS